MILHQQYVFVERQRRTKKGLSHCFSSPNLSSDDRHLGSKLVLGWALLKWILKRCSWTRCSSLDSDVISSIRFTCNTLAKWNASTGWEILDKLPNIRRRPSVSSLAVNNIYVYSHIWSIVLVVAIENLVWWSTYHYQILQLVLAVQSDLGTPLLSYYECHSNGLRIQRMLPQRLTRYIYTINWGSHEDQRSSEVGIIICLSWSWWRCQGRCLQCTWGHIEPYKGQDNPNILPSSWPQCQVTSLTRMRHITPS